VKPHLGKEVVDPGYRDRFGEDGPFLFCKVFGVFVEGGEREVVWEENGPCGREG